MIQTKIFTAIEFVTVFILLPSLIYFHPTRWNVHIGLWIAAVAAMFYLKTDPHYSWRQLWQGRGWELNHKKAAVMRFFLSTVLIILITKLLAPERIFAFPIMRPGFWLIVMVLYPILSVIPQEFLFRSYFSRRYRTLFSSDATVLIASAICFSFVHIVFHNLVSPTLCLIAGCIFAYSYNQHRALKWVVIEHAAYGCMVFTVGIGFYFLVGGGSIRP